MRRTHDRFAVAVKACEKLSHSLPVAKGDGLLSQIKYFLANITPDNIIKFLPADKTYNWLRSAAICLRSDIPRDYKLKISEAIMRLQQQLNRKSFPATQQTAQNHNVKNSQQAEVMQKQPGIQENNKEKDRAETWELNKNAEGPPGRLNLQDNRGRTAHNIDSEPGQGPGHRSKHIGEQQRESQTSKDPAVAGFILIPRQPGGLGGEDGSLDPDASAGEQEEQGEPSSSQSRRSGKRKHRLTPAYSKYKRPRFESTTAEAVVGKRGGGGGDDSNQPSSRLRQRIYPEDEGTEAGKDRARQGGEDRAQNSQVEHALTRNILANNEQLTKIHEANSIIDSLLKEANQSLISQYIERTSSINTIKSKINTQKYSTYYYRITTRSLYRLLKTPILIKTTNSAKSTYFSIK